MNTYDSGLTISNKIEKILNNKAECYIELGDLFKSYCNDDGIFIKRLYFRDAIMSNGEKIKYSNPYLYDFIPFKTLFNYVDGITLNATDMLPKMYLLDNLGDNKYTVMVNCYTMSVNVDLKSGLQYNILDIDFTPTESQKGDYL